MILINRTVDITRPVKIDPLGGSEYTAESLAHTFRITVTQGGEPVALSGGAVTAYFLNAAGHALAIPAANCTVDADGCAVVTLVQACYQMPGRFLLTIYYTVSGADETAQTCIYAATGDIVQALSDPVYDPGTAITDISAIAAEATAAAEAAEDALAQASAVVSYEEQTGQTDAAKAQARANIGAVTVTVSGTTMIVS